MLNNIKFWYHWGMAQKMQQIYKDLEQKIVNCASIGTNIIILTTPDTGASHLSKLVVSNNPKIVKYIDKDHEELSNYNLLNLNFYSDPNAISIANKYFKTAKQSQKFALLINNPSFIDTNQFHKSFVAGHIYDTSYLGVRTKDDTYLMISELNPSLTKDLKEKIYELSGGIARLIKFFSLNTEKLSWTLDNLMADKPLLIALRASVEIIQNVKKEELQKFGYVENNKIVSVVLDHYFKLNPIILKADISINKDLTFSENGVKSDQKLTKIESDVLNLLIHDEVVKREQISDLKWGEGSYDKYSDQAINKTVERINKKIKFHKVVSVPKVGYKLILK